MESSYKNTTVLKTNTYLIPLIYFVFALLFEVIQFLWMGFGVLPKYFLFDLATMIIGASIIFVIPTNVAKTIVMALLLSVQMVLNITNITLYNVFGDVFSFDMLKLGHEVGGAFSFDFIDFFNAFVNIGLLVLAIISCVIVSKKVVGEQRVNKKAKLAIILAVFFFFNCFGISFYYSGTLSLYNPSQDDPMYIAKSDAYLYDNLSLKLESYKKFGTFGYYLKLIDNTLHNPNVLDETKIEEAVNVIKQDEEYKFTSAYSDVLKGDNLIMILMESFDWFAINPVYTPTLYSIAQGTYGEDGIGYSFDKFYGRNKTNISEGISFLGNMPKTEMLTSYESSVGLSAPYSLPNLLRSEAEANNQTYRASYFHSLWEHYYARNTTYDKLGFDNFVFVDDIYPEDEIDAFGDWVVDQEFIEQCIDEFIPTDVDRFYTQFASLSTHGPYNYDNPRFYEYIEFVEDNFEEYERYIDEQTTFVIPESKSFRTALSHYLAGAIDLDRTVNMIIENLKLKGLHDNTTIVLFSDHYSYYDDLSAHMKGNNKDDYSSVETYHIPFLIYSAKLGSGHNDNFCSAYDIYPTLCDLLGFAINKSFIQGNSIFSEDIQNSVFVSHLTGIFNDKLYSTNMVDITKVVEEDVSIEEVETFQKNAVEFYTRQDLIEKLWKNNLFKYLIS